MRARLSLCMILVALAAACTSSQGSPEPRSSPAVNAATAPLLPTNALELPDFTFDRFQQLLSQLRGTPVVVNIWGSWCGPCKEEGPHLAAAARTYGRRVQFVGVDIMDERGPARSFITGMGWTYPSVFDPSPRGDIRLQLGYFGQPITIFYDRDGKVAGHVDGPSTTDDLESGIREILR